MKRTADRRHSALAAPEPLEARRLLSAAIFETAASAVANTNACAVIASASPTATAVSGTEISIGGKTLLASSLGGQSTSGSESGKASNEPVYQNASQGSKPSFSAAEAANLKTLLAICKQQLHWAKLGQTGGAAATLATIEKLYGADSDFAADYKAVMSMSAAWITHATPAQERAAWLQSPKTFDTSSVPFETTTSSASVNPSTSGGQITPAEVRGPSVLGPGNIAPPPNGGQASAPSLPALNNVSVGRNASGFSQAVNAIHLDALASAPTVSALASATTAQWVGETDGALVTWLGGDSVFARGGEAVVVGGSIVPTAKDSVKIIGNTVAPAGGMLAAAMMPRYELPAEIVYRFATFDPARTFADAMADFARESATITQPGGELQKHAWHRAWMVTGAVLFVDAVLVARWYGARAGEKKKNKQAELSAMNLVGSQVGPLPTGL